MGSECKSLDLKTIRERAMSVRDPKVYQLDAIRAFYLNDIAALLAEVERLRPQASHDAEMEEQSVDGRAATNLHAKVYALREEVERLTSDFRARSEARSLVKAELSPTRIAEFTRRGACWL